MNNQSSVFVQSRPVYIVEKNDLSVFDPAKGLNSNGSHQQMPHYPTKYAHFFKLKVKKYATVDRGWLLHGEFIIGFLHLFGRI